MNTIYDIPEGEREVAEAILAELLGPVSAGALAEWLMRKEPTVLANYGVDEISICYERITRDRIRRTISVKLLPSSSSIEETRFVVTKMDNDQLTSKLFKSLKASAIGVVTFSAKDD